MSKTELCNFIKDIFQKNKLLSSYSFLINTYFLDGIFTMHLKQYVSQIDLDDIPTIRNVLESSLQIKLDDYFSEDELDDLYFNSKKYIQFLLENENIY
jgi:hypothetical protein